HVRWYSPHREIAVQSCFTVVVGLATGAWLGPGATGAYGFTGAIGTVAIIIVYMLSNIAHIRYFWRIPERSAFTHVIVPGLSVVSLAYPLYSVAAPGQLYPYNWVPVVVLGWIAAGVLLYYYYRAESPEKIAAIGTFIADDDIPAEPPFVVDGTAKQYQMAKDSK
ncbi:MAG: amino acid/polyamine/organocation transporter, superfamily, partial [Gammaproteobacteria bacterium]|nr:amino acid/polyamine/organocation transporter, superfamily [Gammaproteobacteria bacterium]